MYHILEKLSALNTNCTISTHRNPLLGLLRIFAMTAVLFFFENCVKKEADGKEFCAKNCKTACEMAGTNVSSCIKDCIPSCENAGPNPFYDKK